MIGRQRHPATRAGDQRHDVLDAVVDPVRHLAHARRAHPGRGSCVPPRPPPGCRSPDSASVTNVSPLTADAVGLAEDRLEVGVLVGDRFETVLTVREGDVHVHAERARAVQREEGGDVLEPGGPQLADQRLHPGRVELEDPEGVPGGQLLVDRRVVHVAEEGGVVEVDLDAAVGTDVVLGVGDDGEVAQAEEVHLEQAQRLARAHLVLGEGLALVGAQQRHDVGQRLRADDDRGGVDAVLALQALERLGGVEHPSRVRVVLVGIAQLRRLLEGLLERRLLALDRWRHRLAQPVAHRERVVEHPGGVADRRLRLDGPEGDDLRHPVLAVALGGVADHLGATTVVEVHVDVGHLDARRVEEALEDEAVLDRVDLGDPGAVRDRRPAGGPATRADPDPGLACVVAEVGDDQEVRREAHLVDDRQLVLDPVAHRGRERVRVEPGRPVVDLLAQVGRLGHAVGAGERRQQVEVELELGVAHLGDVEGGAQRVRRDRAELAPHLLGGADVVLGAGELETVRVADARAGLDAQERVVRLGVARLGVVAVVGDHRAQPEVLGQLLEPRPVAGLLGDAVVHLLDEEPVGAEDVAHPRQRGRRRRLVVLHEELVGLATEAAGQHDQAGAVLLEQLVVDARLVPVALEVGPGRELDQVVVADVVHGERRQVVVAVPHRGPCLVAPRPVGEVGLHAEDRLDAGALPGPEELREAEEVAVIGGGDRRHPVPGALGEQLVDAGGAVEHGELGVHVEVDELVSTTHVQHPSRTSSSSPSVATATAPRPTRLRHRGATGRRPWRPPWGRRGGACGGRSHACRSSGDRTTGPRLLGGGCRRVWRQRSAPNDARSRSSGRMP